MESRGVREGEEAIADLLEPAYVRPFALFYPFLLLGPRAGETRFLHFTTAPAVLLILFDKNLPQAIGSGVSLTKYPRPRSAFGLRVFAFRFILRFTKSEFISHRDKRVELAKNWVSLLRSKDPTFIIYHQLLSCELLFTTMSLVALMHEYVCIYVCYIRYLYILHINVRTYICIFIYTNGRTKILNSIKIKFYHKSRFGTSKRSDMTKIESINIFQCICKF